MASRKRQQGLRVGDRARSKLNGRIGTVDAVDQIEGQRRYGLHYDEAPQDRFIAAPESDGARLPADCIERE